MYRTITSQLQQRYSAEEARTLIQWVMDEAFGMSMAQLLMCKDNDLSAEDHQKLQNIIAELLKGVPVQYAVGTTTFCGHQFVCRPGALIPRPETQELVHRIANPQTSRCSLLDIGTGTGCIAISLALAGWDAMGWDISQEALSIAQENATRLGAICTFEQHDILNKEQWEAEERRWDVIVSNPPYVRQLEAVDMEQHVLDYEPHLALFVSDDDPLIFYRSIGEFALSHLHPQGLLYFEINQYLANETKQLLEDMGYCNVTIHEDQFGNPRMIKATHP